MSTFHLQFTDLRDEQKVEFKENIESVKFEYDSPDDTRDKASTSNMTLIVKGVINDENDDETLNLINEWVKLEGHEKGAYCKVSLKVIGNSGRCVREYTFPQAFAVDYFETFEKTGDKFEIKIRQRQDKLANSQFTGGYPVD